MTRPETRATAVVRIDRIRQAARVLDAAIPIPGTKYSFGIDAVIGLVPGLGDAVGVLFASVILFQAFRLGASKRLLTRMLYNVGVDGLLGAIPLLGDWHDVVRHLQQPDETARASGWFLLVVLGAVVGMGVAAIFIAVWVIRWLLGLF